MHPVLAYGFVFWLLYVFVDIALIVFTARLAASKGHSPMVWGLISIFFPVIALIIVAVMRDRRAAV